MQSTAHKAMKLTPASAIERVRAGNATLHEWVDEDGEHLAFFEALAARLEKDEGRVLVETIKRALIKVNSATFLAVLEEEIQKWKLEANKEFIEIEVPVRFYQTFWADWIKTTCAEYGYNATMTQKDGKMFVVVAIAKRDEPKVTATTAAASPTDALRARLEARRKVLQQGTRNQMMPCVMVPGPFGLIDARQKAEMDIAVELRDVERQLRALDSNESNGSRDLFGSSMPFVFGGTHVDSVLRGYR